MTQKSKPEFSYEVITQEDPETGDLILPLPPKMLEELGWQVGDSLDFGQDDQGRWIIKKL